MSETVDVPRNRALARRGALPIAAVNLLVLGALTAPAVSVLPLRIAELVPTSERSGTLALVLLYGAVGASIGNPLFGYLSDLGGARWGRRPWLIGGVAGGFLGSVAVALLPGVGGLAIAWAATQFAYNASLAASAALLADRVPESERSRASGLFGAAAFLGTLPPLVLGALLTEHPVVLTLTMPAIALIGVTLVATLGLPRGDTLHTAPAEDREVMSGRDLRLFALLTAQRAALQLAFSFLASFTVYFAAQRLSITVASATPLASLSTALGGAAIVISALLTGALVARRGRYGPVVVASALGLGVAGVLRATATDAQFIWLTAALGGLALGAFYAVDLAAAMRLVGRRSAGRALGVFNLAETLPQTAAPALTGWLLAAGTPDPIDGGEGYTLLFVFAAALAMASALAVPALAPALRRTITPAAEAGPHPR